MKKKLNIEAIRSELEGSVFFRDAQKEPGTQDHKEAERQEILAIPSPAPRPEKKKITQRKGSLVERNHDTVIPRNHDTTTPSLDEDIFEKARKAVKQIGKEAATHRFTLEEKNSIADIEYSYRRQGIRTSENEITRIAINYIIEEHHLNGEQSLLSKILKLLNS